MLGAFGVLGLTAVTPTLATPPTAATFGEIDRFVADQRRSRRVPGFALAIVDGDRTVHARGFGSSGGAGAPISARTPFVLGSTSKSFTALAVMQLVDAGRVALDDLVVQHVPELRLAGAAERRITVRQLLNQTSGLPAGAGGRLLRSVGDGDDAAVLAELRGTALRAEPGASFLYSNANYVLLGMVVAHAAGRSFETYVRERIFEPLGMRDSFTSPSAAKRAGLAVGHRYWFGFPVAHGPTSPDAVRSAGYLMSSAADMARYLSMFLNGGVVAGRRLVSKQGLAELLAPTATATLGAWSGHHESRYAMGWFVGGPWHEQATLHLGGAPDSSSMIVLLPRLRLAVVTLASANTELPIPGADGSTDRIARGVVSLLVGERPETGFSLTWFYIIFDVTVAATLGLLVFSLVRLRRRRRPPTDGGRRTCSVARGAVEALLGILSLAAPVLLGQGYAGMFLWTPDLVLVLLVIGFLLALTGFSRIALQGRSHA